MKHEIRLEHFDWSSGSKFGYSGRRVPRQMCYSIYEHCEETDGDLWLGSFLHAADATEYMKVKARELDLPYVNLIGKEEDQ